MNLYNVYEDGVLFLQNVGKRQIILSKIGICSETIDKYVDTPRLYKKKYRFECVLRDDRLNGPELDSIELFRQEWDKTCKMVKLNAKKRQVWNKEHGISTKWCFTAQKK